MLSNALKNNKLRKNMKCTICGKEIKGEDCILMKVPNQKDICIHSMPCEWYNGERNNNSRV